VELDQEKKVNSFTTEVTEKEMPDLYL